MATLSMRDESSSTLSSTNQPTFFPLLHRNYDLATTTMDQLYSTPNDLPPVQTQYADYSATEHWPEGWQTTLNAPLSAAAAHQNQYTYSADSMESVYLPTEAAIAYLPQRADTFWPPQANASSYLPAYEVPPVVPSQGFFDGLPETSAVLSELEIPELSSIPAASYSAPPTANSSMHKSHLSSLGGQKKAGRPRSSSVKTLSPTTSKKDQPWIGVCKCSSNPMGPDKTKASRHWQFSCPYNPRKPRPRCDYCGKSFSGREDNRQRHMRSGVCRKSLSKEA